jgi:phage terminase large subunit GpA-like protein
MTVTALTKQQLELVAPFLEGLKPPPRIGVREWADTYRFLPDFSARPGKFSSDFTPYVKEPMDRLSSHDPAQKVIVKKSSQVGFTEMGNNWLGYIIDIAPAPMLYVMPTDTMVKETVKKRIEKMIESTPALAAKISPSKSRDKSNTLLYKEFRGGFAKFVGANSPNGLSSDAVRYVYMDETDRYPQSVEGEGSPEGLAETRTITFGARKKMLLTSTPTIKGVSFIDARFEITGQRYYHVPCPFCSHYQVLDIDNLRNEPGKYTDVKYECCECGALIDERFKTRMLKEGKWIPKYPEREDGITYGYFINAMYSPSSWFPWSKMVKERDEAENDVPKKIVFTNTKLGLAYENETGDKPDWEALYDRAENYPRNAPFASVALITAGVDVQADRLEMEIVGWMKGKISQQIDYRVLYGDTSQDEVWRDLDKLISETWVREGDKACVPLHLVAIDTGYNTEKVYAFAQKHGISRVIPVKGRENLDTYVSSPKAIDIVKAGQKIGRVKVWGVGVTIIKSELYGFLKVKIDKETGEIKEGYCHFPQQQISYFRGLTAEEVLLKKNKRGFDEVVWVKKYKRNEPLDCRVYARAAAYIVGMDRWSNERWGRELRSSLPEIDPNAIVAPSPEVRKTVEKKKSDFWKNT